MDVQRGDLAEVHAILEQDERTIGLLRRGFPDVQAAAVEPSPLALLSCSHQRLAG